MLSSAEGNTALVAPLLRVGEFEADTSRGGMDSSGEGNMETSLPGSLENRMMFAFGPMSSPGVRNVVSMLMHVTTAADSLPSVLRTVVTSGKMSVIGFVVVYMSLIILWMPFWLLSFFMTEYGVYFLAVVSIFFLGRSVIRLIAFPGSSSRVKSEIEGEFAKYSVRMLVAGANCLQDLANAVVATGLRSSSDLVSEGNMAGRNNFTQYEIPGLWKKSKSYRDRAMGVYLDVLLYVYENRSQLSPQAVQRAAAAMNPLSGDIGNFAGLTAQARDDGRALAKLLGKVIGQVDKLEKEAGTFFSSHVTRAKVPSDEARITANDLLLSAGELRDFVSSLKPPSDEIEQNNNDEEDMSVGTVRRKLEEQGGSVIEAVKTALGSVLPMLDPPPHTSIFGFDVLRGCMLSRYEGSRQLWVRRPTGGMIDVIHIPARLQGNNISSRNQKAVLYCNPNAGLIEVATGMSLAGGNAGQDSDNISYDNCWADFYTELGFDVYLFNYAGFGRSYGTSTFDSGNNKDEVFTSGIMARTMRIFRTSFLDFKPTPDSLRADGLAVANYLMSEASLKSLVIHGESIGGVAASRVAQQLCLSPATSEKVALLLCDRSFCNLEAVAQRLVGNWSGYGIRMLAPFWNTDVVGDFIAADCPKVVANDFADMIIADPSSLKTGIALWREIQRGTSTTKGIGWEMELPVEYRVTDWENVCITDSKYVSSPAPQPPVWPADKHISVVEAVHFASCVRRIGKLAKKSPFNAAVQSDEEQGIEADGSIAENFPFPIIACWEALGSTDGLCGAPLGHSAAKGYDNIISWLCSCVTYGGQQLVEKAAKRLAKDGPIDREISVIPSDFDLRPEGYQKPAEIGLMKSIPEVMQLLKSLLERNGDASIMAVKLEMRFIIGMFEYITARLSSPKVVQSAWLRFNLKRDETRVGTFLPLHCNHNNAYSASERARLTEILRQCTRFVTS